MGKLIHITCGAFLLLFLGAANAKAPADAPAAFDNLTNGYITQATYDSARAVFEQPETIASGLGPIYNGKSCFECHLYPVAGGNGMLAVTRAGHLDPAAGDFVPAPGGVLMHTHAIDPKIDIRIPDSENIRSQRKPTSILGDGYVEAIADETLLAIAQSQKELTNGRIAGEPVLVPIAEA